MNVCARLGRLETHRVYAMHYCGDGRGRLRLGWTRLDMFVSTKQYESWDQAYLYETESVTASFSAYPQVLLLYYLVILYGFQIASMLLALSHEAPALSDVIPEQETFKAEPVPCCSYRDSHPLFLLPYQLR